MAFVQSFQINITADPSAINIVDTSTGSDGAIVDRVITLYKTDNSVFGTFDFPLSSGSSITINPLVVDLALNIQINWNNNVGSSLYTYSKIYAFTGYGEFFYYSLTQEQTGKPTIINDQLYFSNKSKLRTLLDSANQAISIGNDIYSAQSCIAQYQLLLQNPTLYF